MDLIIGYGAIYEIYHFIQVNALAVDEEKKVVIVGTRGGEIFEVPIPDKGDSGSDKKQPNLSSCLARGHQRQSADSQLWGLAGT